MTFNPVPPELPDLIWRSITRDDLAALVDLAGACYLADGGLSFMIVPDELHRRYFPGRPGTAIGAFTPDERLIACAAVHLDGDSDIQNAVIVGQV